MSMTPHEFYLHEQNQVGDKLYEYQNRMTAAEASVGRVRALHEKEPARYYRSDLNPNREFDCMGCGEGQAWPCPTIRAIEGGD